jgi:hypothetical protein
MARYTVVIRPEDAGDGSRGEATVVVETASRTPRIVEMTIRASSVNGVSAVTMPSIDLEGVVRALSAGVRAAEPASASTAHPTPSSAPTMVVEASDAADASRGPEAPARRSDRPYRQMPPAEDLQAVYDRVGTVTGMAAHYGVPRHTAQGWMARLRKMSG